MDPPVVEAPDDATPNLLVDWTPRWENFKTSVGPAMQKSKARLAGEAHGGLFPYKGMLASCGIEIFIIILLVTLPVKLAQMQPRVQAERPKLDVIYYSGAELPRTEDLGGAETGVSGKAGGDEAFHKTQTIRVARGTSRSERVVDAPEVKLPHSNAAVANLLAFASNPGPPPTEGLRSSARSLELPRDIVAPAPQVQRDKLRDAPSLSAAVVAPSQSSPQRDLRATPSLAANAVAPAPSPQKDQLKAIPSLESKVIAPTPGIAQRELSVPIPGSRSTQIVPPPVSAPERFSDRQARLSLPAAPPVAPAPQVSRELASGPGSAPGRLERQMVVPPPVQMTGGSTRRGAGQGIGGGLDAVPPTVEMSGGAMQRQGLSGGLGGSGVVPPPVQVAGGVTGGALGQHPAGGLGGGSAAVPPPPSVSGGGAGGFGTGNRGNGRGGIGDLGEAAAPPTNGAPGNGRGVVVSKQPGSEVGLPGNEHGALAMSPAGGSNPGFGGTGGGEGLGRGDGSGSGFSGNGPGAGKVGTGKGTELNARGGISPYPGPGGAGTAPSGTPAVPGVSVRGGNTNIVTLPSFSDGASAPNVPGRSAKGKETGPGITIVASARSGGAFNFYGALKGDKVYTIYIDTNLGPAVFQFADPTSAARPYAADLVSPQPIRADVPDGLARSRLVIACVLDRTGTLRGTRVLEPGDAVMTSRVLASLPRWKFQPATRDGKPVEVNAILGFNIDTNDRF
jgi:hypothetical protein